MASEPFFVPFTRDAARPIAPVAGPGAYQSFITRARWRTATCAEVGCGQWREGWVTTVDESTQLGREQGDYVRHHSGRRYRERRTETGWTAFEFHPGQTCFAAARHMIQADEPGFGFLVPGDHRATTGPVKAYDRLDQMVDDFRTHTDRIAAARSQAGTAG